MTKSSIDEADAEQDAAPTTEETTTTSDEATADADGAGADTGDADDEAAAETEADEAAAETEADEAAAEEGTDDEAEEPAGTPPGTGSTVAPGAAAVVSAGLGLASITGTWLSDLMSRRQEIIGQINTSSQPGTPADQVDALYGTPAHTTALFNGFVAVAAVIVAVATLLVPVLTMNRDKLPAWIRAVACGGLALGVMGLAIAGVMWFDVFTDPPVVPEVPAVPPAPGG